MILNNICKLSELEGAIRIDAEYYQQDYYLLLNKLKNAGAIPLKKISYPIKRRFQPIEGEHFNYIEISEVDLNTGEFNTSRILGEQAPDRAQFIVKKNDVLISTVRPIRNAVVIILEDEENLICSSGFCIMHPKKISPLYLFLYFKTDVIAYLLNRYTTSTEYPAVSWVDILNIPIYLGNYAFREKIIKLGKKAFDLLKESQISFKKAEDLLLEELELKNFKFKYNLFYTTNLSKTIKVDRIDAEYYDPRYDDFLNKLKAYNNGYEQLLINVKNIRTYFNPKNYPDKLFSYIELANINSNVGVIKSVNEITGETAPSRAKRLLKNGDVIVSSVEGSLNRIALIDEDNEGALASTGFFQFRTLKILPEALLILIKSIALQTQFKRECRGTILRAIPNSSLKEIIIPLLPIEFQKKIAILVQRSHQKRRRAKNLINKAKKIINKAIGV